MRRTAMLAAVLTAALGAGVTTAQTSTTTAQTQNFTDIPAGHWATDAVRLIAQRGLIQGYPDGSFRGNQPITRYEAAMVFFRLLQSGQMSNMSPADLQVVTRGMQEVASELAALAARVSDLEQASADQRTRIATLEQQIASAAASNNNAALTTRITTLEQTVQRLQAQPAPAPAPAANTAALEARIAALEAQLRTLQAQQQTPPAPAPAQTPPPANTGNTGTTGAGVAVNPGGGTTTVVATPATPVNRYEPRTFVGISAAYPFTSTFAAGTALSSTLRYGITLGTSNLLGNFGGRFHVDYQPATSALSADVSLATGIGGGGALQPYFGAGAGVTYSGSRVTAGQSATDIYVNGLIGADFKFTDGLGLFIEANPRYYLSNNGTGTNLDAAATGGFGITARAGLKFWF